MSIIAFSLFVIILLLKRSNMTLFSLAPGSLLDPPLGDPGAFFIFHFALKFQRSGIPL